MKNKPVIAVVGATGLVGSEMIAVIEQLKVPFSEVRLLASQDSVGEVYKVGDQESVVEVLDENSFKEVDIALFATSAELAKKFVPIAVEQGAFAIDNSRQFRMDKDVPLVVPEVNWHLVSDKTRLIANPNCSTIQLVPVLKAAHELAGLKRVVVSTYQAVSGAGKAALDELWAQTVAVCNQKDIPIEEFQHQIAFNCIPQIDVILEDGYTREEYKIINESRKILGLPELRITATAVRVPVFHGHAESVNIETERELSPEAFLRELGQREGIEAYPAADEYPMQINTASTDTIQVGRVRRDESVAHGLNCWIVADNVRKGAALNAVQIAKRLIEKFA
ncbi:MAG: aspartate-semialdehyde dehydrogenase [Deltaproteobacteria bacterium]|nr:aspartate-semialdehyde dehydrogenase [Deltaproteobacteria bacterium]